MGVIRLIHCKIDHLQRAVTLKPRGRSILIIGQNGSGKTSLLGSIHKELKIFLEHNWGDRHKFIKATEQYRSNTYNRSHLQHPINDADRLNALLRSTRDDYRGRRNNRLFKIDDVENFAKAVSSHEVALKLFSAHRRADIQEVQSAGGLENASRRTEVSHNLARDLEQHLVNLKVRAAIGLLQEEGDLQVERVNAWFLKFEKDLRYLFEDESVSLRFDANKLRYFITQEGRSEFSFKDLSSGYSAIFDIFGDLIVRAEYLSRTPEELVGVVFIDEIDAHLHVSLQRKVLPFLMKSFPGIQFIVTTHSPFVLSSVDNVLIYDLSSGKSAMDLSMYSVDAILEGLLRVPPISKKLENLILSLARHTEKESFDLIKAKKLLDEVSPYLEGLDTESRMYYELSRRKIIRAQART
ncbi:ATP-binding protein [Pseudomonas cichorii]|nr:ATP-binding protein [Pseudomonas cichorii]